jgi:hypothetical protein
MRLAQILLEENGHLQVFEVGMLSDSDFEPIKASFLKLGCQLENIDSRRLSFTVRMSAAAMAS